MTKTICDICGDEMLPSKFVDTIEDLNFCISSHGKIWDICPECRVSLAEWMLMRKQKEERAMDKWQKLKGFLTDGKEHITKDVYVSRPSVFEEILDIMEELEKREVYETEVITRGNCMMCGKELTEGLFFCKECEEKANSRK